MAMRYLLSSSGGHGTSSSTTTCAGTIDGDAALAGLVSADHGDGHDDHDHGDAFNHIYFVMIYVAALWFAGKLFLKLRMPALVGEIVFGIILGPHLLNLAGDEGSAFLIVIGEIGLVMLVVEAGLDVDVGLLKLIGPPALGVAIMGSIFPISMGIIVSYLGFGQDLATSIAIGACFGPTSMGIALNVLKGAKLLNTPTGQLIIAAAILDDVIALMILSELGAMRDPSAGAILIPLIVSPVLILIFGYLAIRWVPRWIQVLMNRLPKESQGNAILALLFIATFVMVPTCHFLGSSHLLGAFLAGLMFCTDHTIHHVWQEQVKRILAWMLRIFFSATIGFAIPITDFGQGRVLLRGFVYCICMAGKVVTGFFARPLTKMNFFTIGFSMSAWGEFAFILATASYAVGALDQESFSSVLLAVLLSVIISPYLLSANIAFFTARQQKQMDDHLEQYEGTNLHPVYFAINSKSRGSWGHQDKILHRIFNLQLEIIDFRSWHAPEYNHTHHQPLTKESFYVMDKTLALPPTKHLDSYEKEALVNRVKIIRREMKAAMGDSAVISIKRWLPGVSKKDDELEPQDNYIQAMFGGEVQHTPKHNKSVEYCRQEAFKQAHSIMSVFERKATLEDLKQRSMQSLHASAQASHNSGRENENSLTFSDDLDGNHAGTRAKSYDQNKGGRGKRGMGSAAQSVPDKRGDRDRERQRSSRNHAGQGFQNTGAGGAGAVPYDDKTINPVTHFTDEDSVDKHRDESHMSYIYGDEDSQHHKLPEYSQDGVPEYAMEMFQPRLPQLDEDQDDVEEVKDNMAQMERDMKMQQAMHAHAVHGHTRGGQVTSEDGSDNDEQDDNAQTQMEIQREEEDDQLETLSQKSSKLSKLTIKVYPPAMKSVPSASPTNGNGYMD